MAKNKYQTHKQIKEFFLGFLFKQLDGLRLPRGLNEKDSEKYSLFITKKTKIMDIIIIFFSQMPLHVHVVHQYKMKRVIYSNLLHVCF